MTTQTIEAPTDDRPPIEDVEDEIARAREAAAAEPDVAIGALLDLRK